MRLALRQEAPASAAGQVRTRSGCPKRSKGECSPRKRALYDPPNSPPRASPVKHYVYALTLSTSRSASASAACTACASRWIFTSLPTSTPPASSA